MIKKEVLALFFCLPFLLAVPGSELSLQEPLFNTFAGCRNVENVSGMIETDKHTLLSEVILLSCIVDSERGYVYFGTGTFPGQVIKLSLARDGQPPQRVGTIVLEEGEDWLSSAVFDQEANELYFGTGTDPAHIVRVHAGEGEELPRRLESITLRPGEAHLETGFIEKSGRYAYWGSNTSPAQVIMTRLADSHSSLERIENLSFQTRENSITHAIYDALTDTAYFSLRRRPGRVVQVSLSEDAMKRKETIDFEKGEDHPETAIFDEKSGRAFYGTAARPAKIVEVSLERNSQEFKRVQTFAPVKDFCSLSASIYNPLSGSGYFATRTSPAYLLPFDFNENRQIRFQEKLVSERGVNRLISAGFDEKNGTFYFGSETSPGQVLYSSQTIDKGFKALSLEVGENNLSVALTDVMTGYSYFGTGTWPGKIVQVKAGNRLADIQRKAAITLEEGENLVLSGTIDQENGLAYFGTWEGAIIQIALERPGQDFERRHTLDLSSIASSLSSAVYDNITGHVYFGSNSVPARIIKVQAANGTKPMQIVSVLELPEEESNLTCAVINPEMRYALFGTANSPAYVIKIDPGTENKPMRRTGSIRLEEGENNLATAFADHSKRQAYFGTVSRPGRLIQIDAGEQNKPPVRMGVLELEPREYHLGCSVYDAENRIAYLGTETLPARLVKVHTGEKEDIPQRISALQSLRLRSAALTPDNRTLLTGMYTIPGRILKTLVNMNGMIHGTPVTITAPVYAMNMNFYTLAEEGNIRLALYSNEVNIDPELLWASPEITSPVQGDWIKIAIAEGEPQHLELAPGSYILAWQTDSPLQGGGYCHSEETWSFAIEKPYGTFPGQLPINRENSLPVCWSIYLDTVPAE